jgi:hypothetical protein
MNPLVILRSITAVALLVGFPYHLASAWGPLQVHPQNPYLVEFRGQAAVLRSFGQHYSAVVDSSLNYLPYLDVLQRDGMNLTRVWPLGFPADAPATAAQFIEPWLRSSSQGNALDGQGKWDFSTWNEAYFTRLGAFAQACSDRGIVAEITLFSTFYNDSQWQASPFHPSNNVQAYGPANRYDCLRSIDANLLAVQTAAVRRIVTEVNRFDNIYFETYNEPFWNEPLVQDSQDVEFNNRMLGVIRTTESGLPNRHLVAHNFPQQVATLSLDFDVINDHYPTAVVEPEPNPSIAGADALLRNHYSRGKILALDETDTTSALSTRLESWMFLLGGGGIYNGLDAARLVYTQANVSGDNAQGNAIRNTVSNAATYVENLHLTALRRNLDWINGGIPTGATLQAMATPGQQYVAYLYHGQTRGTFQLEYNLIDGSNHTASLVVTLEAGTWRAVWTRPADMVELHSETFTHAGGELALAPVTYQEDVALRIDRTGVGDTTPPPNPTGLSSRSNADGAITLSWNPVSAADLASYHIYRADTPGVSTDAAHRIAVLPASETIFRDVATLIDSSYHYIVTALDLSGNESTASREINATSGIDSPTNTAPVAVADAHVTDQNTPLVVPAAGVLINDTDAEANPLTAAINTPPSHGGLLLNPNGGFTFTPSADYTGPDSFTYHANDGSLDSNIVTVTITVNPLTLGTLVNGSFEQDFTGWTSSGNLAIQSAPSYTATHGSKLIAFNGGDTVPNGVLAQTFATAARQSYTLAFDAGVLSYNKNSQKMRVTVSGSGSLLSQTITIVGLSGGTKRWLPYSFTFVADSTATTLTFSDQSTTTKSLDLLLDNVRITGTVSVPNTAPVAVAESYSTPQNTPLVVPAAGLLANDTDAQSNPLTAVVNVGPVNGSVILNLDGGFSYTPATGYTGADSFTYHANDGNLDSNVVTVAITVNALVPGSLINGSFEQDFTGWTGTGNMEIKSATPYATPYAATSGSKLVAFNGGNSTPNGVLTQTFATAAGQSYTLAFDAGVLSYNTNQQKLLVTVTGSGSLLSQTITINGLSGGTSRWLPQSFTFIANSASTTLTFRDQSTTTNVLDLILDNVRITGAVSVPNTAPVAVAESYSVYQDTPLVVPAAGVLANDTDAQSNPLTAAINALPGHGGVILNTNGGFTFTPTAGYTGPDSFTYHANDGNLDSNIVTVSIAVNAVVPGSLVNGSFEQDFTGWTSTGNIEIKSAAPYAARDGSKLIAFNAGNSTPNGVLTQTFPTATGQSYTLAFDAGVLSYNTNPQKVLVTVTGGGSLLSQTITINGLSGGTNRWLPQSYTFVADSTSTTLTFRDQSTATNYLDLLLDNVRVTEPAVAAASLAPPAASSAAPLPSSALLAVPPQPLSLSLGAVSLTGTPGNLAIRMTATEAGAYILERSEDLKTWDYVSEMHGDTLDAIEFHDPATSAVPEAPTANRFYRIRLQPDIPAD